MSARVERTGRICSSARQKMHGGLSLSSFVRSFPFVYPQIIPGESLSILRIPAEQQLSEEIVKEYENNIQ